MNITEMSLCELALAVNENKITAVEAAKACFDVIHKTEDLNNFISLTEDRAMTWARDTDERIRNGEKGLPLAGVPIAVKDNIDLCGALTTCGSELFKNNMPTEDSEVVKRLKRAGAVIVGKTNMDELAMGSTNKSSAFGAVKNAVDNSRVPGGSSGGSANCIAAKQAFGAIGTDTGGSIRQPAAYCGVVGLKPTYGAIDTAGLTGFVESLDTVGIFARDCDDASVLFDALSGVKHLPLDADIKGKRLGIVEDLASAEFAEAGVAEAFLQGVRSLEKAGAKIIELRLDSFKASLPAYHVLSSAEAARNILREVGEDKTKLKLLGEEVRRRLMTGLYVTVGDNYDNIYMLAVKVRAAIKRDYARALSQCDAVLSPAAPTVATLIAERSDPVKTHGGDSFLAGVSLAGLPAASVPCGKANGLPVGMQIIGAAGSEREILNVGKALMRVMK